MSPDLLEDVCSAKSLPNFSYPDPCNYLIHGVSFYSCNELKAFKSLTSYNNLLQGWMIDFKFRKLSAAFLFTSKVLHSQSIASPPLQSWVIVRDDGTVETAHCTCMAGLDEACSHIATTLFGIEAAVKSLQDTTCTSKPCYWLGTRSNCAIPMECGSINFFKPSKTKLSDNKTGEQAQHTDALDLPFPSREEKQKMYRDLAATGVRSAILSIVPGYASNFTPRTITLDLPASLKHLYSKQYTHLSYFQLCGVCKDEYKKMKVTENQATVIEKETREQSKSRIWFQQRCGRITASNFKAVCVTDCNYPSVSLVKKICYPESYNFSNEATRYGQKYEKTARECYVRHITRNHSEAKVELCGLIVHPDFPYLGASPDGKVYCQCCGAGVIEIKCPYRLKDVPFSRVSSHLSNFFLKSSGSSELVLDKSHAYYYQVLLSELFTRAMFFRICGIKCVCFTCVGHMLLNRDVVQVSCILSWLLLSVRLKKAVITLSATEKRRICGK